MPACVYNTNFSFVVVQQVETFEESNENTNHLQTIHWSGEGGVNPIASARKFSMYSIVNGWELSTFIVYLWYILSNKDEYLEDLQCGITLTRQAMLGDIR